MRESGEDCVNLLALSLDSESDCESGDSMGSLVPNPVGLLEEAGAVSLGISAALDDATEYALGPPDLV